MWGDILTDCGKNSGTMIGTKDFWFLSEPFGTADFLRLRITSTGKGHLMKHLFWNYALWCHFLK